MKKLLLICAYAALFSACQKDADTLPEAQEETKAVQREIYIDAYFTVHPSAGIIYVVEMTGPNEPIRDRLVLNEIHMFNSQKDNIFTRDMSVVNAYWQNPNRNPNQRYYWMPNGIVSDLDIISGGITEDPVDDIADGEEWLNFEGLDFTITEPEGKVHNVYATNDWSRSGQYIHLLTTANNKYYYCMQLPYYL